MFAVGGNDDVARLSGIRTDRTLDPAHVLCSLAAGVAGLLIAARFGTGDALVYDYGLDLDSIAAVVLGGTLLFGGRGSVAGTVAGVGILAVLDTVFNALEVDPFFKDVAARRRSSSSPSPSTPGARSTGEPARPRFGRTEEER